MSDLLAGKVVLVTGVGPGLGRETVAAVLREGGRAVVGDLSEASLRSIRGELDPDGARIVASRTDIADPQSCEALVAAGAEKFGQLDAVVQIAALDAVTGGLLSADTDDLRACFEVNLIGSLTLTRAAVPLLDSAGGAVVMIGTIAAVREGRPVPMLAYGVSKGALRTAVWHLAHELGPLGIRVNTIAPGWKQGPVLDGYFAAEAQRRGVPVDEVVAPIVRSLALRRMATDADVANAAVFFCSDLARSITGQTVFVDGGDVLS